MNKKEKKKFNRVLVDGPIAIGKSATLIALQDLNPDNVIIAPEPLEQWENAELRDGTRWNYLEEFYKRPSATTTRQMQVLTSFLERYLSFDHHSPKTLFLERSMRASRDVFLEMSKDSLDLVDYTQLTSLANYGVEKYERKEDQKILRVYLAGEDEVVLGRFRARGRESEQSVKCKGLLDLKVRMDLWARENCEVTIDTTGKSPAEIAKHLKDLTLR